MTPRISEIQQAVCEEFGLTMADMLGPAKRYALSRPRQMAMFMARQLAHASYPEIALRFGGRDHTTAMHAVRSVERRLETDERLLETLISAMARTTQIAGQRAVLHLEN